MQSHICMIFADKLSLQEIRMEFFKKYATVIGKILYICSINMPYYALMRHKNTKIFKTI